ncbi:MAG: lipid-binding protein [Draconibacterium sp.]
MRKLIYISIASLMVLSSCFEEKDNWYSNTRAYDGRFVVAITCEEYSDDNKTIKDGEEVLLYNSAANVENEIIIDTHVAGHALKGKFSLAGTPLEFSAEEVVVENISRSAELSDNDFYVLNESGTPVARPSGLGTPDTADVEYPGVQLYSRLSLLGGNIRPDGATTIGGNTSDSIYVKVKTYCDFVTIESYLLPEEEWNKPDVPEYAWRLKENSRSNASGWEENWTFSGYRYTGFPEDLNPDTPIIETE